MTIVEQLLKTKMNESLRASIQVRCLVTLPQFVQAPADICQPHRRYRATTHTCLTILCISTSQRSVFSEHQCRPVPHRRNVMASRTHHDHFASHCTFDTMVTDLLPKSGLSGSAGDNIQSTTNTPSSRPWSPPRSTSPATHSASNARGQTQEHTLCIGSYSETPELAQRERGRGESHSTGADLEVLSRAVRRGACAIHGLE